MVKIIELTEAEDLKPLEPGKSTHLSGQNRFRDNDSLAKIATAHDDYKSAKAQEYLDYDWDENTGQHVRKTADSRAREEQELRLAHNEMQSRSLEFVRDVRQMVPFIEKNCSKYLPIAHNKGFLYRGFNIQHLPHAVFYANPRDNRLPRDSNNEMQAEFDYALQKLGVKALRSNSIFCAADIEQARAYGLPFIIIPCNDAAYAWSQTYHDIVLDTYQQRKYLNLITEFRRGDLGEEEYLARFQSIFGITTDGMDQAMAMHHEIWVTGHYVAVLATLEPQLRKLLFR